MNEIDDILGPGGVLARAIPGYEGRPSQLAMAERVSDALARRRPLLVEAGTGTGKTLAYLVPAIQSGLKVVVSTGTKNLQEQIFKKDIPLLQEHLARPFTAACMKGISNYLCLRRFHEHTSHQASLSSDGNLESTLDAIRVWADGTESGDRGELPDLADDSPAWRDVSPTQETRLGQKCKYFERCFVTQARRRAYAADIVIVNHHLFFADLALRSMRPDVQLLPPYEAVIFDEAHQLEDIATDYFGVGVSSLRLMALTRDLHRAVGQGNAPDKLLPTAGHVDACAMTLFDALRRRFAGKGDRVTVDAATWSGETEEAAHAVDASLEELEAAAGAARGEELNDRGDELGALGRRARAIRDDLALLVEGAQKYDRRHVFWAEQRGRTVLLHASPVDVSEIFRERLLGEVETAIFTSATLTAGGSFEFVRARLGLESAMEERLASPFDYARQALLYVPKDLPEPGDAAFAEAAARRIHELVNITDGRAFLLFTSHRQMQRVHQLLAHKLKQPVLLQGDKPKHLLIEEFKRRIGSVLFATASFWEGVDVVGEALSLVVIDKLPFSPPDDPLVAARAGLLEDAGQDPFSSYHVPRAALALAQGFGRLIRHRSDRGVVALLDRRAVTRSYGRKVLAGLPPDCPRTQLLEDVRAFWTRQTQLPLVAGG
ncbi:MAG: DinG family ATP-dependent helicase YoaA [Myxococcales bacterium]|nr:DinG family ATP-dependent helicase YoaA [Myxococcales bacterium]